MRLGNSQPEKHQKMNKTIYNIIAICCFMTNTALSQEREIQFPIWEEGILEIHHINTGRGDAAFFIFPDATTLLVDAGDMSETLPRTLSPRNAKSKPNSSKSTPEWIVNYIHQFFPKNKPKELDYALVTHYHDDHFGGMDSVRKLAKKGDYYLTGITGVGNLIPIKTLIDRGSDFPIDLKDLNIQNQLKNEGENSMINTLTNYWKFIDANKTQNGSTHETLNAGSNDQIVLKNKPYNFPEFQVRNIAVNGNIWTGEQNNTYSLFSKGEYPGENPLSTCIKLSYGSFDYFTGGDIKGINAFGGTDLNSIESHIAPVVGAVDVATLNHHGNRDSQNEYYVRTIRPRVWVQQNWSSDHPGEEVLRRITSRVLYPGERDIFSTVMLQANKDVIGERLNSYKSQQGHIVIRVHTGGDKYDVFVLDDNSEKREVLAKFGPYQSR